MTVDSLSGAPRGSRLDRFFAISALLLVLAPFGPLFHAVLSRPWLRAVLDDDNALIELQVRDAARGRQLVGPYSRFDWNHPGPVAACVLLPAYELLGEKSGSLVLGAVLVNATAAAGIVLVATRLLGAGGGLVSAVLLAGFLAHAGPRFLWASGTRT